MSRALAAATMAAGIMLGSSHDAKAIDSIFSLDSLSFVSFQNEEVLLLPPGSTLLFRFGAPSEDGSIDFVISPSDVSIAPVEIDSARRLFYGLASEAIGTMRMSEGGRIIELSAVVAATISPGAAEPFHYSMPLTTERVVAENLAGNLQIEITGMRVIDGAWHVQLVGATTNKLNAYPKPGAAVYTVLSGTFDVLPDVPPPGD